MHGSMIRAGGRPQQWHMPGCTRGQCCQGCPPALAACHRGATSASAGRLNADLAVKPGTNDQRPTPPWFGCRDNQNRTRDGGRLTGKPMGGETRVDLARMTAVLLEGFHAYAAILPPQAR